jgi:hypothetical protein
MMQKILSYMTSALSATRSQDYPCRYRVSSMRLRPFGFIGKMQSTLQTPELFAETVHGVGMMNLARHEHPAIDLAKLVKSIPEADLYRYTRRRWL